MVPDPVVYEGLRSRVANPKILNLPPNLQILLNFVTGAADILRFWPYAHRVCMFFYFISSISEFDFGFAHYASEPFMRTM